MLYCPSYLKVNLLDYLFLHYIVYYTCNLKPNSYSSGMFLECSTLLRCTTRRTRIVARARPNRGTRCRGSRRACERTRSRSHRGPRSPLACFFCSMACRSPLPTSTTPSWFHSVRRRRAIQSKPMLAFRFDASTIAYSVHFIQFFVTMLQNHHASLFNIREYTNTFSFKFWIQPPFHAISLT